MNRSLTDEVRLPKNEEPVAAVTILDGNGSVVRVVPATEFRRATTAPSNRAGDARRHASRPAAPAGPGTRA